MNREESIKRLEEAQKLPHATLKDLRNLPKGISENKLSEYLKDYVKPTGVCWFCEESLMVDWGIQHGVAHCVNCGVDVRMYHFPKNDEGEEVRFERSLQSHPKNYSVME